MHIEVACGKTTLLFLVTGVELSAGGEYLKLCLIFCLGSTYKFSLNILDLSLS